MKEHPMKRPSEFVIDSMLALPLGCVIALVWANTLPESYFRASHAVAFFINEIALAFFLAIVSKEVVEATVPGGELHPWRRAALPMVAALGGVAVPLALYVFFLRALGEQMLIAGWVVICAVDISASYIVGRMIFGRRAEISFLLLLAISMNVIGLAVLAALHPIGDANWPVGLALMAAAIGAAFVMRRQKVRNFWPYIFGPGVLSWAALYLAGVHPALALVPIMPFLPHAAHDAGMFVDPAPQAHDTLTAFERFWRLPIQGVLLLFGLVNAGFPIMGQEAGMWAVPVAVVIGRPIGVVLATAIGVGVGLHLPKNLRWRDVPVIGCITSVGLAMALFFAAEAMATGPLQLQLKMGALLTVLGAGVAFGAARLLRVGRFEA
jgi:Na+:H+ antiporter, NhaA family